MKDTTENKNSGLIASAKSSSSSSSATTADKKVLFVNDEATKLKNKEEAKRLWNRYTSKNKPTQIRDQLIKRYAYLVNWVAGRFPNIETADFDKEDLIGYGTIGLIEAIDRYNPSQACSFETFAINRVRGEVLDFLRSRDFLSRTGRTRVKRFQVAVSKLEDELGRAPTEDEIKNALNLDTDDLRTIQKEANSLVFSLDSTEATRPFEDSKVSLVDNLVSTAKSQEEYTEQSLLRDTLKKAIDSLNPRERLVVALYHYQKLTFREIGEVLGVSESRASQLHMKVLQKLRVIMRGYDA